MKRMVFISPGDPRDRKLWSGTISFMADFLEKKYLVKYIRVDQNPRLKYARVVNKMIKALSFNKFKRSMAIANASKKYLEKRINSLQCDLIFAPAVSEYIALCRFDKPMIYLSDATYHALLNYYIFNSSNHDQKIGNIIEYNAIKHSAISFFSSQWAADDAINYYHISNTKVKVIPFGANFDGKNNYDVSKIIGKEVRLLFVGADWKRKGGDVAIETVKWLNKNDSDHKYSIDIVGTNSIEGYENEKSVLYHGYIDKNELTGMEKIRNLYKNAHFYIIPTRAECCSMTYQEASSFGVPSLTYDTGGTSSGVKDGINGFLLEAGSPPSAFGEVILSILKSGNYEKLCKTTKDFYNDRLTWDAWLSDFVELTEGL